MTRISIGILRFVELFSEKDKVEKHSYDAFINSFQLHDLLGKDFEVIGSINGMDPIFQLVQNGRKPVLVFDSKERSLVPLANSYEEFLDILSRVEKIWKEYQTEMFLPRSPENILTYKQFINEIKLMPGIDYGYWIDFAFKELDIRYEV